MKRLWAWFVWHWCWMWSWVTETEPEYQTVTDGSRDRTLSGKARRRARQGR